VDQSSVLGLPKTSRIGRHAECSIHHDRPAAQGCFTRCVTTSPIGVPARLSLATGLYPRNTDVWRNVHYTMPPETDNWMRELKRLSYCTSVFGKIHLHPHVGIINNELRTAGAAVPRFDLRDKGLLPAYPKNYADVYVGQQAKRYLEQYDRDEPWCCWLSFGGPHEPWDTPEPYASRYRPEDMPAPAPRSADDDTASMGMLQRWHPDRGITSFDITVYECGAAVSQMHE
jgi:arylsulfatase A-like enzyme